MLEEQSRNNNPVKEECPMTNGRPTSKTATQARTQCNGHQNNPMNPQCRDCMGKYPEELTILPEKKADTVIETCQSCEKPKNNLVNKDGERMCPACVPMYVNAKLRPRAVIKALKKYHKLTDLFPADNEQANIQKISDQKKTILNFLADNAALELAVEQLKKELIEEKAKSEQCCTVDHMWSDGCPLTQNRPVSTTKDQFDELCKASQKTSDSPRCASCKGAFYPRELTFITDNQVSGFFDESKGEVVTLQEEKALS